MRPRNATKRGSAAAWARAQDAEVERERLSAIRLAATYGPCAVCSVDVGEDGIHAATCTAVPTYRRANSGRLS